MTANKTKTFGILAVTFLLAASILSACLPESAPAEDPAIAEGQKHFTQNCASCHSTSPDQVIVGPSMHGVASRAGNTIEGQDARTYIASSIVAPEAYIVEGYANIMPDTFQETLSEDQITVLVEYLLTFD